MHSGHGPSDRDQRSWDNACDRPGAYRARMRPGLKLMPEQLGRRAPTKPSYDLQPRGVLRTVMIFFSFALRPVGQS